MNNYLSDSGIFFQQVSNGIQDTISDNEIIQLSFNLALGFERLLKGILYDINPTYILINPDFQNSLKILYPDKIISENSTSQKLEADEKKIVLNPKGDVITFKTSIAYSAIISKSVHNHKNVLYVISKSRDIIAHCELNLLNKENMRDILQRDFYTTLKSFAKELKIDDSHFFDKNQEKLFQISQLKQTDLTKKINLLLEVHKDKWNSLKGNPDYFNDRTTVTSNIYTFRNKEEIICPSCGNKALISKKSIEEFNFSTLEEEIIGYQIKKLKCYYCELEITDAAILDELKITDIKTHSTQNVTAMEKNMFLANKIQRYSFEIRSDEKKLKENIFFLNELKKYQEQHNDYNEQKIYREIYTLSEAELVKENDAISKSLQRFKNIQELLVKELLEKE